MIQLWRLMTNFCEGVEAVNMPSEGYIVETEKPGDCAAILHSVLQVVSCKLDNGRHCAGWPTRPEERDTGDVGLVEQLATCLSRQLRAKQQISFGHSKTQAFAGSLDFAFSAAAAVYCSNVLLQRSSR